MTCQLVEAEPLAADRISNMSTCEVGGITAAGRHTDSMWERHTSYAHVYTCTDTHAQVHTHSMLIQICRHCLPSTQSSEFFQCPNMQPACFLICLLIWCMCLCACAWGQGERGRERLRTAMPPVAPPWSRCSGTSPMWKAILLKASESTKSCASWREGKFMSIRTGGIYGQGLASSFFLPSSSAGSPQAVLFVRLHYANKHQHELALRMKMVGQQHTLATPAT